MIDQLHALAHGSIPPKSDYRLFHGLPPHARASDPRQPHIVSYAFIVIDDSFEEIEWGHNIIKQDGWTCDPGALEVHGITPEISMEQGIDEKDAVEILHDRIIEATHVVAHNLSFDKQILRIGLRRFGFLVGESEVEGQSLPWAITGKEYCTMKVATPLCKVPHPNGRRGFKWPKLKEACEILLQEKVQEGKHDALEDVRACSRLFRWLCENGHGPKPKEVLV